MTRRVADMTPAQRAAYDAYKAKTRATNIRRQLKPQDHMDMVLLYDLGLWPREQISAAYGVSMKTLRNARAKYPATHIVWKGTT